MIEIAKIARAHGIHGEVKAILFSDNVSAFCERGFAYLKSGGEFRRIEYTPVRTAGREVVLQIDGVATRSEAENLRGAFLYLDRSEFEEADDGEFYICDLIGLKVADENGAVLGELGEVLQHGAADVYVVKAPRGFMFPALHSVIQKVDIAGGVIVVDQKALSEVAVYED